jgi:hypothetical protein
MKSKLIKKYLSNFFRGFKTEYHLDGTLFVYFENGEDALIITEDGYCFIDKDLKKNIKTMFGLEKQEFNGIIIDWVYDKFKMRVHNIV